MANVPLIHQVIPMIDYLHGHLEKVIDDCEMHSEIWHAAQNGVSVLEKYYACMDESDMYRMAMSMPHSFRCLDSSLMSPNSHAPSVQAQLFFREGMAARMD